MWYIIGSMSDPVTPPPLPPMDEDIPFANRAGSEWSFPPGPDPGDSASMRMLLPVGRSGLAIAAGYLRLFSFLAAPAPIALVVSILAIRELQNNRKLHGMGRAIFGLVMGIAGTIALVVIVISLIVRK